MDKDNSEPQTSGATVTVPLKRPPLWSTSLTLIATVAATFGIIAAIEVAPDISRGITFDELYTAFVGVMFWLLILVVVLAKRTLVRLFSLKPIAFHDGYVILPRGPESVGHLKVPYGDIMAVNEGGRGPRRHFFIESRHHVFHLPQDVFRNLDGPETLLVELRRRILSLPQGASLIEQTERGRLSALQAMTAKPLATQALLGVIGVFYVNTALKGALDTQLGLLRWGANAPALVRQGEYFRLFAANFLHGNFLHVFMNGLALYYLGTLLERLLGSARFIVVYLVAGLAAMLASATFDVALMTVGASGAVFGLLGGFAVVSWRLRAQLPLGLRQPLRWWVFIIGINALLPLLLPMVDVVAHLAGFIVGAFATLFVLGPHRRLPRAPGKPTIVAAAVLIGMYGVGLAQAVRFAAANGGAVEQSFAERLLNDDSTSAAALNSLAWMIAIDPKSTPEALDIASKAAQRAVNGGPDIGAFHDTFATVASRLGHFDEAIASERHALQLNPDDAAFYSQLFKFFTNRLNKSGPVLPRGIEARDVSMAFHADAAELELKFDPAKLKGGGTIYAVVTRDEQRIALAHVDIGKEAKVPLRYQPASAIMPPHDDYRIQIAMVDTTPSTAPSGEAHWEVWPVVSLPY